MNSPEEHIVSQSYPRPYGVTVAVLTATLLYGIWPLMPLLPVIWSQANGRNFGVDFIGGPLGWISMGLAALILIASVFAWIGRPRWIREFYLGLVWLATLVRIIQSIQRLRSAGIDDVGGSLSPSPFTILTQFAILILIPLYITWYLNRAPAREFYNRTLDIGAGTQ
jgi:hypothetical protein